MVWFNIFKFTAKDRWEELSESNREELSKGLAFVKEIVDMSQETINHIDTFEDENGELLDESPNLLNAMREIRTLATEANFMATETMHDFLNEFNQQLKES